jgi:tripartite-type tricarboxylate transporter receptor subunit TctC
VRAAISAQAVVRAPADGYFVNAANAINTTFYEKLNFNFLRDIAPIAGIVRLPFIMVVNPSVPAKRNSDEPYGSFPTRSVGSRR